MHIDSFQFGLSHCSDLKNVFTKLYSKIYDHRIFPFLSGTKNRYFNQASFFFGGGGDFLVLYLKQYLRDTFTANKNCRKEYQVSLMCPFIYFFKMSWLPTSHGWFKEMWLKGELNKELSLKETKITHLKSCIVAASLLLIFI